MGMKIYGTPPERDYIGCRITHGHGYGDGHCDGSGYGSGYGDGYGYSYGSGYSYGDGCGYGSGYSYGDGCGYDGYGYGHCDGYGDGDGHCDGSGYGDGEEDMSAYLAALVGDGGNGLVLAIWRSNRDGTPANGGGGEPVCEGLVQEVEGPLELCSPRALHATLAPLRWNGERWWIVGLHEPVAYGEYKIGSLKRTILKDLGCPRFTNESQ